MSEEFVDVSQLCKMAEACDDAWVIEFLDCSNLSGIPSGSGSVIAFSRKNAAMVAKQCLLKMWQERYSEAFTQMNMLRKFLQDHSGNWFLGETLELGSSNEWIGVEGFLLLLSSLQIANDVTNAEKIVNDWLDNRSDYYQWPGADYYVLGEKWGCAGFSVDFKADRGFKFSVFSDA
jgi:hypothetical protein